MWRGGHMRSTECPIMAALWNRAGHYIFALRFLLSFFLVYFQPSEIGCLPHFHTRCGQCEFRMQVWNVLHAARWKYRTQKIAKKSPFGHHRTTLSGYIFANKACIDSWKQILLSSNISSTCPPQYGELRPTSGWDRFGCFGAQVIQQVSRIGSVTARHSSSGRQPNFAALNRWRHLYLPGGHHVGHRPTF